MPAGRRNQYLHHGLTPAQPARGWSSEAADINNPPYAFLSGALANNTIDPFGTIHHIYNNHPELYCIEPKRFPRFFKKAVLNVKNIDLDNEEESSKLSSASSRPSSVASTLPSFNTHSFSFIIFNETIKHHVFD